MVDKLFSWGVRNRSRVIFAFKLLYLGQIVVLYLVIKTAAGTLPANFGRVGIIFYILTVLPGMFRRFGVKHKLLAILMIFRRYLGIAMFLSILIHSLGLKGMDIFVSFPKLTFELMGLTALFLLSLMFITSNDISVKFLGGWWKWVHKLTYVIIWLIMLHTVLQRISVWSVLTSVVLIGQVASFLYSFVVKKLHSKVQISSVS